MKILITSGGTSEYIDDVRILTNISSGKLGAIIADTFLKEGHSVMYLHGKNSKMPTKKTDMTPIEIDNANHLLSTLKMTLKYVDVVIHSMAVSDFSFKTEEHVKIKSNGVEGFIEYIKNNIKMNPKVISHIKKINPKVFLVGFKFESTGDLNKLMDSANKLMLENDCDLVLANDKQDIIKNKSHIGYLISKTNPEIIKCKNKKEIANNILKLIEKEIVL